VLRVLFRGEWGVDGRGEFCHTNRLSSSGVTGFSGEGGIPDGQGVVEFGLVEGESVCVFKEAEKLGLQTLDSAVHIRAFELEFVLPIAVVFAEQRLPVGLVQLLPQQVVLALALPGQLPVQHLDVGDVGVVFG